MSYVGSKSCLETTINTNTTKRYTQCYGINTNEQDWKLIWPQLVEEIHAIIEVSRCRQWERVWFCILLPPGPRQNRSSRSCRAIGCILLHYDLLLQLRRRIWINGIGYDAHFPFIRRTEVGRSWHLWRPRANRMMMWWVVSCWECLCLRRMLVGLREFRSSLYPSWGLCWFIFFVSIGSFLGWVGTGTVNRCVYFWRKN